MIEERLDKRINFLLGKNGCGKSTLLRDVEQRLSQQEDWYVKYITPERGGSLVYSAGIEQNILNDANWLKGSRRTNRFEQFREQSVAQFRNLELFVLREIEQKAEARQNLNYKFETVVEQINDLLPLVNLSRAAAGFEIHSRSSGARIEAGRVSSGESESIALAIEALVFSRECQARPKRLLLIDEPDVHLHPDLQARYIRFLEKLAADKDFRVLIATHSTAIVGSVQNKAECQIAFMPLRRDAEVEFSTIDDIVTTVLPMFGAHPLSNIFNESPVLLVEGDDDKRIWEQVMRSTQGRLALFPCPAGSVDDLTRWESWLVERLPSIYDDPRAYSLRDRDDDGGELDDRPPVLRFRLGCRASENLMLADETLSLAGTDWAAVVAGCQHWIGGNPTHPQLAAMRTFEASGFDRFNADLKGIRNVLLMVLGVTKPWEVLVGQAIASFASGTRSGGDHSLSRYLGTKLCVELLKV